MKKGSAAATKIIQVFVVDDHPMLRERLSHLIEKEPDMTVCGEADNIRGALERIIAAPPDIAIVDITLKGSSGLELIKDLKSQELEVPVLVLSMHDESLYAERALRAGARGYITKHEASEDVMVAIRCVLKGDVYLSKEFTALLLHRMANTAEVVNKPAISLLTDRELEVFRLIGEGRTTRQIAELLTLGGKTVDTYRDRIKQKLGLKNTAELYHAAVRHWQ